MLVRNWKSVMMKSWTVWAATIGIALPEALTFLANNTALLAGAGISADHQNLIRLVCLLLVIFVRPLKQSNMPDE